MGVLRRYKKKRILSILSILLLLFLRTMATNVGGAISTNTTWNLAGSPYIVTGNNIIVDAGVTLTISPGVTVKFDSTRSMQVDGTLRAIGTSAQPITFTANTSSPTPGFWGFILFNSVSTDYDFSTGTGGILEYCTMEYAGGVNVPNIAALRISDALPYINNCTILNNKETGINFYGTTGNLFVNNCTIKNNNIGIEADGNTNCSITVNGSNITHNLQNGIYVNKQNNLTLNMSIKYCILAFNGLYGIKGNIISQSKDTITNSNISNNNAGGFTSSN